MIKSSNISHHSKFACGMVLLSRHRNSTVSGGNFLKTIFIANQIGNNKIETKFSTEIMLFSHDTSTFVRIDFRVCFISSSKLRASTKR